LGVDVAVVPENVTAWCDVEGYNLLELVYADPAKYGAMFQFFVAVTQLQDQLRARRTHRFLVVERWMGRKFFIDHLIEANLMTELDRILVDRLLNLFAQHDQFAEEVQQGETTVYLRCRPETAFARMRRRGRKEEEKTDLAYLTSIHEKHESYLCNRTDVIIVDCENLDADFTPIIDRILGEE
jgi:deoxyadenosine/deoxycytidine kinase